MENQAWLRTMLAKEYLMDTILEAFGECLSQHEKILLIRFARKEIGLGELQSRMIYNTQLKVGLAGVQNVYLQLKDFGGLHEKGIGQPRNFDTQKTDGKVEKRRSRKRKDQDKQRRKQTFRSESRLLQGSTRGMCRRPGKNPKVLEGEQ